MAIVSEGSLGHALAQFLENVIRQMVLDLDMPRYGLRFSGSWILIPVVSPTVPDQDAAQLLQPGDKLTSLHATSSSPTCRTAGMAPLVNS